MPGTRNSLLHLLERAIRRPGLIWPYLRRRARNWRIRRTAASHPEFYRAVMADDVRRRSARGAVGTPSEARWLALGQLQFDYLVSHGLRPEHDLLEIGCGNLRAGWRLIGYLEPGRYTGVDISPDIVTAAHRTVVERWLQDRRPTVTVVDGTDLGFLPDASFDVIHAHSVFSHTPPEVIDAYLAQAARLLRPGGFFDFTYNRSDRGVWDFLQEDYYYPTAELIAMAAAHGLTATPMDGWDHKQDKLRAIKRDLDHGATLPPDDDLDAR